MQTNLTPLTEMLAEMYQASALRGLNVVNNRTGENLTISMIDYTKPNTLICCSDTKSDVRMQVWNLSIVK